MRWYISCLYLFILLYVVDGCGQSGCGEPRDCYWSNWSSWSACTVKCGNGGTQERTRYIEQYKRCGGSRCFGPSSETRECSQPCPRGEPVEGRCHCPFPYDGECCTETIQVNNCDENHIPLNQSWRSTGHKKLSEEACDSDVLMNYWYRFTSNAGTKMPVECVRAGRCGVKYPIWLKGEHPSVDDGVVTRQACTSESTDGVNKCCQKISSIKIENCGDYYIYLLPKLRNCNSGYCAGNEIPCPNGTRSENGFGPNCIGLSDDEKDTKTYRPRTEDYSNLLFTSCGILLKTGLCIGSVQLLQQFEYLWIASVVLFFIALQSNLFSYVILFVIYFKLRTNH